MPARPAPRAPPALAGGPWAVVSRRFGFCATFSEKSKEFSTLCLRRGGELALLKMSQSSCCLPHCRGTGARDGEHPERASQSRVGRAARSTAGSVLGAETALAFPYYDLFPYYDFSPGIRKQGAGFCRLRRAGSVFDAGVWRSGEGNGEKVSQMKGGPGSRPLA